MRHNGIAGDPVDLAYREQGSGPPIVLLAGTGYAGSTWPDALVDALAERHAVVTVDYRGTGGTPGDEATYSTRLFAADVIALLERLQLDPATVLGHSMGGRVAQWVALDAPERVRSLVLAASGAGAAQAWMEQTTGIPLDAALQLIELGYAGYMRRQIARTFFTEDYLARQPEAADLLFDAFWAARPNLRNYLKHVVARQSHSTVGRVSEIRQPTLVLVGDQDTHVGGTGSHLEQSKWLAANVPVARLQVIAGAAHGYFWQCPDESIRAVLAFIASP